MSSAEVLTGSADGAFSVSSQRLDRGILIAVAGDIDLSTAMIVEDELLRAEQSEELIVLDLGNVTFMDSTGIRMLIASDQRLREKRGSLEVVHVPRHVERLFDLVGITDHLKVVSRNGPDRASADDD